MSDHNNGGPAFPTVAGQTVYSNGMSLRDWFAGQALAGLAAYYGTPDGAKTGEMPRRAYVIADAMLAARNSTPTKGA